MNNNYKGLNYIIWRHPEHLFYCCYVKLPNNHKWIEFLKTANKVKGLRFKVYDYEKIPVDCHGGLTFGQYFKKDTDRFTKGYWIGWDYAHGGDYIPGIYKKTKLKLKNWSERLVEKEAKKVINQILKNAD